MALKRCWHLLAAMWLSFYVGCEGRPTKEVSDSETTAAAPDRQPQAVAPPPEVSPSPPTNPSAIAASSKVESSPPDLEEVPVIDDEQFQTLIQNLQHFETDADLERAIQAAEQLSKLKDRSRLPALYKLLDETDDFFVREEVGIPILHMDGLKALPQLLAVMRKDDHDYDGLASEIAWLVEDNAEQAAPLLLEMLRTGTLPERRDAANLLDYASDEIEPDCLLELLSSDDQELRRNAIGTLGSFIDRPEIFDMLAKLALNDNDEQVRRAAVADIGRSGNPKAAEVVKAALNDRSEYVRDMAEYVHEQMYETKQ